jgi:glycerol-3-phosphate acyltransferase PlsY
MILDFALVAIGYVLGSIPFGFLISKFIYKVDIRELGSKNTGATNMFRVLGVKPGLVTLALDIAKGSTAVLLCRWLERGQWGLAVLCGFAAIMGHSWSIFLKGRGGKSVATSAGVFLALLPIQTLLAILVFAILFYWTRYVSVGSLAAAVTMLGATFAMRTPGLARIFFFIRGEDIINNHFPNNKRLWNRTELKINFP